MRLSGPRPRSLCVFGIWGLLAAFVFAGAPVCTRVWALSVRPIGDYSPEFSLQPISVTQLEGKRVTFSAAAASTWFHDGPVAYQWYFNGDPLTGSAARKASYSFVATLASAGTYHVRATNSQGGRDSDPAVLTVHARPKITAQPRGVTLDVGQPLSLSVAAMGAPAPTFQWFRDNVEIPGATAATFLVDSVDAFDAGLYRVRVTNAAGQIFSRSVSVVVRSAPVIVDAPADADAYVGAPLRLVVDALGFPRRTYQWRFNGEPIPGARAAVFVLKPSLAKTGVYDVVVTNALGSATSEPFNVTVHAAPKITEQPVGARKRAGQSHVFEVVAPAYPAPSYQWIKDGAELTGQTASTLALSPLTLADDGLYAVRVTNVLGTVTTKAVRLEVGFAPYRAVSGGSYRLGGYWIDSDGDSGPVDETYTFNKNGGISFRDFIEGVSQVFSLESFSRRSASVCTVSASATVQGVKLSVTFRFTHTSATAGTYTLKGSAPSVGYSVNQSGSFTYSEPGL